MSEDVPAPRESTRARLARPEMLIALSAVLLSLCALFVSIYETALIRKQQRASVWPHLAIAYSHTADQFSFMVLNLGIGPARIRDVEVAVDGEPVTDWGEMFARLGDEFPTASFLYSSFNHIVVPAGERHRVLWIEHGAGDAGDDALRVIGELVKNQSRISISVSYSSVYDEYWQVRMGDPEPTPIGRRRRPTVPDRSFRM